MRAKFKCVDKHGTETFTVTLEPVNDPADRAFFKDLPFGTVVLAPLTPDAGALFSVGAEVTIDFSPKADGAPSA